MSPHRCPAPPLLLCIAAQNPIPSPLCFVTASPPSSPSPRPNPNPFSSSPSPNSSLPTPLPISLLRQAPTLLSHPLPTQQPSFSVFFENQAKTTENRPRIRGDRQISISVADLAQTQVQKASPITPCRRDMMHA